MTREETKKIIMSIDVLYPNWHPEDLTLLINVWTSMLEGYSYKEMNIALKSFVNTDRSGFAPTVGQLIDQLHKLAEIDEETELEIWAKVRPFGRRNLRTSLRVSVLHIQ